MQQDAAALERIDRVTVREHIYQLLREAIRSGQLPQAVQFNQRKLAAELGVSTTPLKHALRRLADEGLVRIEPRRGVFVMFTA